MTDARPHSLRWRLVRRLVVLQAAMLALFVLIVVAALWSGGFLVSLEPEDETIDALRNAIVRDANGNIAVRDTPFLARRRERIPDFWFTVRDREGAFRFSRPGAGGVCQNRRCARWGRSGAARMEYRRSAASLGADEMDRHARRQRPGPNRPGRQRIVAAARAGGLDAIPGRCFAHRRSDDAGHAGGNSDRGPPNARRPWPRRRASRENRHRRARRAASAGIGAFGNRSAGIGGQ